MATIQKRIEIPMTSQQAAALQREAYRRGMNIATLVRRILHENVLDYPDNMPLIGEHKRRAKEVK